MRIYPYASVLIGLAAAPAALHAQNVQNQLCAGLSAMVQNMKFVLSSDSGGKSSGSTSGAVVVSGNDATPSGSATATPAPADSAAKSAGPKARSAAGGITITCATGHGAKPAANPQIKVDDSTSSADHAADSTAHKAAKP